MNRRTPVTVVAATILSLCTAVVADPLVDQSIAMVRKTQDNIRRFVLDSGMVGIVRTDLSAPVVAVRINIGSGSMHEADQTGSGVAHAIEHMIFKGTRKYPSNEISRLIANAGGNVNAFTSHDRTVFVADMPSATWETGLEVLADAVMNASFPADEWVKEKDVILREIAMGYDSPDRSLNTILMQSVFRRHPYGHPIIGHETVLKSIERKDLLAFADRHYRPDNTIIAVVGNVNAGIAESAIRRRFEQWKRRACNPIVVPSEPPQSSPRFVKKTGKYEISRIECAYPIVSFSSPDAPVLDMLASVAGDGRSSRLAKRLRDELKLVHSVSVSAWTPLDPGYFGITAELDPDKETAAVQAITEEVASWSSRTFSRSDVDRARRSLVASTLSAFETMGGQADSFVAGDFYSGNPRYLEHYLQAIGAVTPESLRAAAARHLQPERLTVAVLSPAATNNACAEPTATAAMPVALSRLAGGVRLLVRQDNRLPFVNICVALRGGLISEDKSNSGITRLTAETMTRGTRRYSYHELMSSVETMGASLSSFSGMNSYGLQMRCFSRDVSTMVPLLTDCLLQPTFDKDEVAAQKDIQLAAIREQSDHPMFSAQQSLRELIHADHPYMWTPFGQTSAVSRLLPVDLQAYHRRHLVSSNVVIAVFGDITPENATRMFGPVAERIPPGILLPCRSDPATPLLPREKIREEQRAQAIVLVGFPGVSITDPRADSLTILENALSGLASTFSTTLREERGMAYFSGAYMSLGIDPGAFVFYAGVDGRNVTETRNIINAEISRILASGLTNEELNRAKAQIIAEHDMALQDNAGTAQNCALHELYGLGYNHVFSARKRYEAISGDSIKRAASSVLSTTRQATAIVRPAVKGE